MEVLTSLGIDSTVFIHLSLFILSFLVLDRFFFRSLASRLEWRLANTSGGSDQNVSLEQRLFIKKQELIQKKKEIDDFNLERTDSNERHLKAELQTQLEIKQKELNLKFQNEEKLTQEKIENIRLHLDLEKKSINELIFEKVTH